MVRADAGGPAWRGPSQRNRTSVRCGHVPLRPRRPAADSAAAAFAAVAAAVAASAAAVAAVAAVVAAAAAAAAADFLRTVHRQEATKQLGL